MTKKQSLKENGDSYSETLGRRIRQARGMEPADLVVKKVAIYHLSSGEMRKGDIAVCGDTIIGVGESYDGVQEIDGSGLTAVPGFFDAHVHMESQMLNPYEMERLALSHGVVSCVADPHGLVNVAGLPALDYYLKNAEQMLMDVWLQLSPSICSAAKETMGARVTARDLIPYVQHPNVLGLAEIKDVSSVIGRKEEVIDLLSMFPDGVISGHAPQIAGRELNALLSAGVCDCHETRFLDEAFEKLRKGMNLLIREGTTHADLDVLAPLITIDNAPFLAFCTDDRSVEDICQKGHIDYMIRRAISLGAEPLAVYRTACLSPVNQFGLRRRGLIAPGFKADFVLVGDIERCNVQKIFKSGHLVTERLFEKRLPAPSDRFLRSSLQRGTPLKIADFHVKTFLPDTAVIGVTPGRMVTERREVVLPVSRGRKHASVACDTAKMTVIERYGKNGNIGHGFVQGLRLQRGALATSIAHDSHHLCVFGVSDEDMLLAARRVMEMNGGIVIACDGVILEELALPVGGLISVLDYEELYEKQLRLTDAVRRLGCHVSGLPRQISFLTLPVLPHLRLTDVGLFDVDRSEVVVLHLQKPETKESIEGSDENTI